MNIYTNNKDQMVDKISNADVQFMAEQLGKFIKIYKKNIYIRDKETLKILNKLEYIQDKLIHQQYNELINDPSIISYDESSSNNDDSDDIPF